MFAYKSATWYIDEIYTSACVNSGVDFVLKEIIAIYFYYCPQYKQNNLYDIVYVLILTFRKDFVVYQDINVEPTKVTDNDFKDKVQCTCNDLL